MRADNADHRLTKKGIKIGIVGERSRQFKEKSTDLKKIEKLMDNLKISPLKPQNDINIAKDGVLKALVKF